MKTLYQTLALLSLPLAIACGPTGPAEHNPLFFKDSKPTPTPQPTPVQYNFDKFGEVINIVSAWDNNKGAIIETRAYDFDGDGDLDIMIRTNANMVIIYENKIPQKNQQNK